MRDGLSLLLWHEMVWFFRRNGLDSRIGDVISYLNHEKAELSEDNSRVLRKGLEIISSEKLSLSHYNDVIILSHSIINELPLVSFDRNLMKLARKYNVKTL
ncbi:MAG: hypothetical protein MjAS7_1956 [Metallosphaera javensis (ex Sakai et al. 2022)]|nr:MAG: hypothetical protein MjAS7_1956 [Metallosphaera javensis (ex Sakai et al. 2022)]